jgi:hypothetical protein
MGLKVEEKTLKSISSVITNACCDHCKAEIGQLYLIGEQSAGTPLIDIVNNSFLGGVLINYTFGYGTDLDCSSMSLTLCDNCLADVTKNYGGLIK